MQINILEKAGLVEPHWYLLNLMHVDCKTWEELIDFEGRCTTPFLFATTGSAIVLFSLFSLLVKLPS